MATATITRTVVAGTATRLQATVTTTSMPSVLKQREGIGLGVGMAIATTVVVFIFCFICIPAFRRAVKQICYGNVAINSQNVKQGLLLKEDMAEEDLEQQEEDLEQQEEGLGEDLQQLEKDVQQPEDVRGPEASRLLRYEVPKFYGNSTHMLTGIIVSATIQIRPKRIFTIHQDRLDPGYLLYIWKIILSFRDLEDCGL
jgi:hypothetical protein